MTEKNYNKNIKTFINTNMPKIGKTLAGIVVSMVLNNVNSVQASEIASNNIPQVKTEQLDNAPGVQAGIQAYNNNTCSIYEYATSRARKIAEDGKGIKLNHGKKDTHKYTYVNPAKNDKVTDNNLITVQNKAIKAHTDRIVSEIKEIQSQNPTTEQAILKQALNDAVKGSYTSAEKAIEEQINQMSKNQTQEFTQSKLEKNIKKDLLLGLDIMAHFFIVTLFIGLKFVGGEQSKNLQE